MNSRVVVRRGLPRVFLTLLLGSVPAQATADIPISHQGANDPTTEGFGLWPYNGGISTAALPSDNGIAAWQISNTGGTGQAEYGQLGGTGPWFPGGSGLNDQQISEIRAHGFIVSLEARVISGPTYVASSGQEPNLSISLSGAFANRFDVDLGLDGNGNTLVILPDDVRLSSDATTFSAPDYQGSPLVVSGTGYHLYQLACSAAAQTATLYVDGVIKRIGYAGAPIVGGGATISNYGVVFGAINGSTGNFAQAALAVGPAGWTGMNNTSWADNGNWDDGLAPGSTTSMTNADSALFNQQAAHSPLMIDAGRNVQNITFDTASVNSRTIGTVGGNALLLTVGGTIQTTSTVVNPQTINAPLVLEGDYTFTSGASNSSATLSFGGGITPAANSGVTTLTLNGSNSGTNTISGVMADNSSGQLAVTMSGSGLWILSGANTYSGGTNVLSGTLRFDITSGSPTITAGVTATVASGATLELAGSVSALGTAGGNRVHLVNNSTAPGVVVSGTNQVVGAIDGSGNIQINAGSDLTADHIIQNALIIGGAASSPALVTIDASDATGNPLGQSSGFALADSLTPSGPFGADGNGSANLSSGDSTDLAAASPGNTAEDGNPASVPEPSDLILLGIGGLALGGMAIRRQRNGRAG